ncbi:RluA family pseudouridine synthase [Paraconexibacter antarcticus]|uniref:Pseudouridine synthase n=1 Tax=Paraconexibacter antarcticus TaxID=2949664 RepID=A0ABY5DNY0_9ACTN|nr:RluA family pseudouridine synthase [Paraconexibacter antarcticus]UTI62893.1 RluA family pseudouridine synthase [Paraconexibacter antarcticus]
MAMRLTAGPDDDGERLDAVLAGSLGSRTRAARLIAEGAVRIGGRTVVKRHVVSAGDEIDVDDAAIEAAQPVTAPTGEIDPDVPVAEYTVAYEDEHLIVVDKPAGVVVHPARGHWQGTLAQALAGTAAGGEDPWRAGLVHRLDKDTSGLLVVAKSDAVHEALKAALQARDITREYLALVEGRPTARSGTIDAPIGRDRHVRTRHSIDTDQPREARTHFTIERALERYTLLRVHLETGRTHQIRVHMQAIGLPIAGDPEYGREGLLGLQRQFLHATRLAFPHPVTGESIACESPLPPDLADALAAAGG